MQTPLECHCIVGPSIGGVNSSPCHGQSAAIVLPLPVFAPPRSVAKSVVSWHPCTSSGCRALVTSVGCLWALSPAQGLQPSSGRQPLAPCSIQIQGP
eukprot:3188964-Alexandrium_andersonii.AAC.1